MPNGVLYAICVLIWGSTWYVLTFQVGVVPAELSVAYRFALAAVLLLGLVALRRGSLRFTIVQHGRMAVQGLLSIGISYTLVYLAAGYLPSGLLAVTNTNIVFMTILFGFLFFGQPLRPRMIVGALIGFSGMALMFAPDLAGFDISSGTGAGLAFALAGTVASALGALIGGANQRAGIPVLPCTGYAMAYAAAAVFLFAMRRGDAVVFEATVAYVGSLVYLAVFGSVVTFACFFTLVARIGADRASYVTVMFPVVALAISTVLEGYEWTLSAFVGAALVLIGNLVAMARLPRLDRGRVPA